MKSLLTLNYKKLEIIENNWQIFPFKLDYIFYILYCIDKPSDIIFDVNNENDSINNVTIKTNQKYDIQLNHLKINKQDLCSSLSINDIQGFQNMMYNTVIFNNNLLFRVQITQYTTGQLLVFRFLDNGIEINGMFNEKIEKFQQYCKLSEKLSIKSIEEKIRKI